MSSEQFVIRFLNEWGLVVGATILVCVAVWHFTRSKQVTVPGGEPKMTREEYTMTKRQRKLRQHTLLADGVAEVLLNLLAKGEMDDDEYKRWHLRFGTQLALKDLLPQTLTPEAIKDAMKKRSGHAYKAIPFPKEEKKYRPKNIIDKVLHPHFTA